MNLLKTTGSSTQREIIAGFGVSTHPDDALDGETPMRLADPALYAAKQRGRDGVEATSAAGLGLKRRAGAEIAKDPARSE